MTLSNAPRVATRLALAGLFGASSLFFASCRTPQSLCDEWYTEVYSTGIACTSLSEEELEFRVTPRDPMNPTRRGCGIVSSVSEPNEIVNDCFPILRDLQDQCGAGAVDPLYQEFLEEFPERIPAVCDAGHFEIQR